jgi:alkylhydroperoxidase family enzyme
VAVLNDAVYEWNAHAPLALKAGVKPEQLKEARELNRDFFLTRQLVDGDGKGAREEDGIAKAKKLMEEGRSSLTMRQWLVLAYTDQMTREVKVEDGLFERLTLSESSSQSRDDTDRGEDVGASTGFSHREVVELTAAIAAYNCVSRFLVALDVGENNAWEMKSVEELMERLSSLSKA